MRVSPQICPAIDVIQGVVISSGEGSLSCVQCLVETNAVEVDVYIEALSDQEVHHLQDHKCWSQIGARIALLLQHSLKSSSVSIWRPNTDEVTGATCKRSNLHMKSDTKLITHSSCDTSPLSMDAASLKMPHLYRLESLNALQLTRSPVRLPDSRAACSVPQFSSSSNVATHPQVAVPGAVVWHGKVAGASWHLWWVVHGQAVAS